MVTEIVQALLIPLLGILVKYLVSYLQAKKEETKEKTKNELATKYTEMVYTTITNCVIATNQVFVDSLKEKGTFDKEAQEKAFADTLSAVKLMLSNEALQYIDEISGDAEFYLTKLIEAEVKKNKKEGT